MEHLKISRCPFCKSEANTLVTSDSMYYCLSCGRHGRLNAETQKPDTEKASRIYQINAYAARVFEAALYQTQGKKGLRYFQGRRLSNETLKSFHLGYAPWDLPLETILSKKGFTADEMEASGLFKQNEDGTLWFPMKGRVIYPIVDEFGHVLGFGGRVLDNSEPKYKNSPETAVFSKRDHLYAFNKAIKSGKNHLILCEGYMDVIAMHQAGFTNAIASLGTALTESQAKLIKSFTDRVILLYDTDVAGQKATERAIGILKNANIDAYIANSLPCKDPDEFLRKFGAEKFDAQVKHPITEKEFRVRTAKKDDGEIDYDAVCSILLEEYDEKLTRRILRRLS